MGRVQLSKANRICPSCAGVRDSFALETLYPWPTGDCARVLLPKEEDGITLERTMAEAGVSARNGKQRRSKRLALNIPVRVYGRTPDNQPFRDITATMSVSAHGGLLQLAPRVKRGQRLLIVNGVTDEERECRVVYVESKRRTKKVGVEFTDLKGDFWHVYTPMIVVKAPASGASPEESSNPRQ
jgi:hypothetical protein